jgi:hypothetical protein
VDAALGGNLPAMNDAESGPRREALSDAAVGLVSHRSATYEDAFDDFQKTASRDVVGISV